jgi:hypothetical protein
MRDTPDPGRNKDVPMIAWLLGSAGLLPFIGLVVLPLVGAMQAIPANYFFQLYAAVILSFMGGVHWGLAMHAPPHQATLQLTISVVPALIAWGALGTSLRTSLTILAAAFVALFVFDQWAMRRGLAPPWYSKLRLPLTAVVVACIGLKWLTVP